MNVKNAIQELIESWLKEHPSRNLTKLSRITGVGRSTLERYESGQVQEPSVDIILKITPKISTPQQFFSFLNEFFPHIFEYFQKSVEPDRVIFASSQIEEYNKNESYYFIYQLCCMTSGTTREKIKQYRGDHGLEILEHMLEDKTVIETNGKITTGSNKLHLNPSISDILNKVAGVTSLYPKNLSGTGVNIAGHFSESLSFAGLKRLRAILQNLFSEVNIFMRDQRNHGQIPVALCGLVTPLISNIKDETKRG